MNKKNRMQKETGFYSFRFRRILSFVIFITLMGLIIDCFARAGGGGGFGGGSSSGGGGGGEAEIIFLLIRLAIIYPKIGIPLLIIAVFLFYYSSKGVHNKYTSHTIRKGHAVQSAFVNSLKISGLMERDSAFSEDSFLKKCNMYFLKIQKAWSSRQLMEARLIISDGVFERFSSYLNMQKASGIQNIVKDVSILSSSIVAVESDEFFDTIHVKITAKAVDYFINQDSEEIIYGKERSEQFVEFWSFLRRPGTKTLQGKSLVDNFCPNCATPLTVSDTTVCSSCSAVVNSGDYDWVLAEITQEGEWRGVKERNIPGLKQLQKKDSAFNIQHIEDLTSVMFWKLREAEFFNDRKYLMKMCDLALVDKFLKGRSQSDKTRSFFADAAIGSVDILSVRVNEAGGNYDEVSVKVVWSGHFQESSISTVIKPDYDKSRIFYYEFVLQRNSNVNTKISQSLVSNHCIGCGAPQTVSLSAQCEYCGLNLNDGSGDWILKEVKPYHYTAYQQADIKKEVNGQSESLDAALELKSLDGPVFSYETNIQLLSGLIAVMNADGVTSESELSLLYKMAANRGVSNKETSALIESIRKKDFVPFVPDKREEVKFFFRAMIKMCLMDGKVDSSERKLLKKNFSKFGYVDYDINFMIKKEKSIEFRLAREKLKAIKQLRKL